MQKELWNSVIYATTPHCEIVSVKKQKVKVGITKCRTTLPSCCKITRVLSKNTWFKLAVAYSLVMGADKSTGKPKHKPKEYNYEQKWKLLQKNLSLQNYCGDQSRRPCCPIKKLHWFFPYVYNSKFAVFWVIYCGITCK